MVLFEDRDGRGTDQDVAEPAPWRRTLFPEAFDKPVACRYLGVLSGDDAGRGRIGQPDGLGLRAADGCEPCKLGGCEFFGLEALGKCGVFCR